MTPGKIYFIHFRNQINGEITARGGMSVAWWINPDTLSLQIGIPARCSDKDVFVKSIGRIIASDRLVTEPPFISLSKDSYTKDIQILNDDRNMRFYSLAGRKVIDAALEECVKNPLANMNSSYFEDNVRSLLATFRQGATEEEIQEVINQALILNRSK